MRLCIATFVVLGTLRGIAGTLLRCDAGSNVEVLSITPIGFRPAVVHMHGTGKVTQIATIRVRPAVIHMGASRGNSGMANNIMGVEKEKKENLLLQVRIEPRSLV